MNLKILEKTILEVNRNLKNNKIKYALIGSANMLLQGMNVNPKDLDIVVQAKDLTKIQKIFSNNKLLPIEKLKNFTNTPAWEIKITLSKIDIQILGEKDNGTYVSKLLGNKLIEISLGIIKIPCLTLMAEAQAYAETNRKQKSDLIKNFINTHENNKEY